MSGTALEQLSERLKLLRLAVRAEMKILESIKARTDL
jgi:hypothetical protein